jgi:Response regulator receiver domain
MSLLILVVDDEPDVEALFRQQFRRDIRDGRFAMDFAQSADSALKLISDAAGASLILILSDINMPGMTGLELLPKAKAARPDVPVIYDHRLRRRGYQAKSPGRRSRGAPDKAHRFCCSSQRDRQPCGRGWSRGPLRVKNQRPRQPACSSAGTWSNNRHRYLVRFNPASPPPGIPTLAARAPQSAIGDGAHRSPVVSRRRFRFSGAAERT